MSFESAPCRSNFAGFRNAIGSLAAVIERSEDQDCSAMGGLDPILRVAVRSGAIKHFEFTYELSWLSIKKWLEANVSPITGDGVTRRPNCSGSAAESRLIDDVDRWMRYHQARNRTSHTYREATANEVYGVIPEFLADARSLLAILEAKND